jgi:hypothetical protein
MTVEAHLQEIIEIRQLVLKARNKLSRAGLDKTQYQNLSKVADYLQGELEKEGVGEG